MKSKGHGRIDGRTFADIEILLFGRKLSRSVNVTCKKNVIGLSLSLSAFEMKGKKETVF